jgi:fructokinase
MDGFHLDNAILDQRGLRPRKGAPETFDLDGLRHLMTRLKTEPEVIYPTFDRALDRSIAGAGVVDEATKTIVIEGNYLLFDAPGWRELAHFWDFSAYLSVPDAVLRTRLMARWHTHGFSDDDAARKTNENDLPNALRIRDNRLPADLTVEETG